MSLGEPPPTVRAAHSLLDDITANSLDQDYAAAARRRHGSAEQHASTGRARPAGRLFLVLGLLGVLLTTAAVQTSRSASVGEQSRASLVSRIRAERAELDQARERIQALNQQVTRAADRRSSAAAGEAATAAQARVLAAETGAGAVTGPGVRIVVDDNPRAATARQVVLDGDLQRLVNGLWVAGAEAIAINGQRLTNLTAIREAGQAITVNFRSLRRPYVVEAIGDPDQLPARFVESDGGSWWLNLRSVYHLRFEMSTQTSLTLPAVPTLQVRHASQDLAAR